MKKSNRVITSVIIGICSVILVGAVIARLFIPSDYLEIGLSTVVIKTSGNIITKSYPVTDFDTINASGKFDIQVDDDNNKGVSVTTDSNVIPMIRIDSDLNQINIGNKKKYSIHGLSENNVAVTPKIEIHTKNLSTVNLYDKTTLHANLLNQNNLNVNVYGKSEIFLTGTVKNLTITTHGQSVVNAKDLSAENVYVKSFGNSQVITHVTKVLDVQSFGRSEIVYYGNPQLSNRSFGSTTLTHK